MDTKTSLTTFEALSHPTRLAVFRALVRRGPEGMSAGDIAEHLGVVQNTMSSHLRKLELAGLVDGERAGRQVIYSANIDHVRRLIVFLMQDCCAGSAEVCEPIAATLKC